MRSLTRQRDLFCLRAADVTSDNADGHPHLKHRLVCLARQTRIASGAFLYVGGLEENFTLLDGFKARHYGATQVRLHMDKARLSFPKE